MQYLRRGAFAAASALLISLASAQTWSDCNPLESTSCPADTALGMTVNVDFTQGEVNSFIASGSPTYGDDGASFTVSQSGDAPQLASVFYIMFGRVELTMKAAPGAGIVSSLVLESDCLDEIDLEWLGADPDEMQSNYFGKGQTTTYNRGAFHSVSGTQDKFITYTIDWNKDRIIWMADGTAVRTLNAGDAETGQYPQTPMQIKFGSWAGGDPSTNAQGTVKWARGPTDYSKGPFSMVVQSIVVSDYSTGKEYKYGDTSGTWESIQAVDGSVNGNENNQDAPTVTATAESSTVTSDGSVPVGGIAKDGSSATATQTGWPWVAGSTPTDGVIPSGWVMTSEGKIMPESAASTIISAPPVILVLGSLSLGVLSYMGRLL